tara:strand:- start:7916 stop:9892 length:1977 start_codon:yes stop_codon:yes gene_type:complete
MSLSTESRVRDDIYEILNQKKYTDVIDALRPNSILTVDISDKDLIDLFCENQDIFFKLFREAVYRQLETKLGTKMDVRSAFAGLKIKPIGTPAVLMQELKPREHENNILTFDCQVIAVDERKSYIKRGAVICSLCGASDSVECDMHKKIPSMKCSSRGCGKQPMSLDTATIETDYIQTIWMQESLDKAKHNSPVTFMGKIYGDYVGDVFIGQKKRMTGIFQTIIDPKKDEHGISVDIISVEDLEETELIKPTDSEVEKIKKDSQIDGFLNKLIGSVAPHIYGLKTEKLAILLHLAKGVSGKKRADINVAFWGDPSTAKSELLKFTNTVSQRSIFTSGKGSTAAGLTAGMEKQADGRSVLRGGALTLANGGFVQIDEFDKMDNATTSSMHEAMEQQTISISKVGVSIRLEAKCSILAAANPKYGRYDVDLPIGDNIDVPPTLLSRFDLMFLLRDKVDSGTDLAKATHILKTFRDGLDKDKIYLSERELTAYLNYVRTLKPKLNQNMERKIIKFYEKMRRASSNEADCLPIGTRQLEAIVRLSQAHAKLFFRDVVQDEDVDCVTDLLKESFSTFGISVEDGGTINADITGFRTTNLSKEKTANLTWKSCEDEGGSVYLVLFKKELVKTDAFDEDGATKWISNWERESVILKNPNGTWRKL